MSIPHFHLKPSCADNFCRNRKTSTSLNDVNKVLKTENINVKINEEPLETVDESADISNETNTSRKTLECDEQRSEVQVESQVKTIPDRRSDRLYRESDGRNDGS